MSDETTTSEKKNIYEFYFENQEKYTQLHGPKTIVFVQIGKFYEAYSTSTRGYTNLRELEEILNIRYICRDDPKKKTYNPGKPNQLGIPGVGLAERLSILTDNGFKIPLFEQVGPGTGAERRFVRVYTAGTIIKEVPQIDSNYFVVAYMKEEPQFGVAKTVLAVGIALIDIATGSSMIHEFHSSLEDKNYGLDEMVRILQTFKAVETLIYYHPVKPDPQALTYMKNYLECEKYPNCSVYTYFNGKSDNPLILLTSETFKITYQNEYLSKIYDFNHQLTLAHKRSPVEHLHLERKIYATIALMIMLNYISQTHLELLRNLSYPDVYIYNRYLILGNNAVEQLNVINSNGLESYNHKLESLLQVIDHTSTPMGRRFLKDALLNPFSRESKRLIQRRYDIINALLTTRMYEKLIPCLRNVNDIEKLHRKMAIGMILPYEFYKLDLNYQLMMSLIKTVNEDAVVSALIAKEQVQEFMEYQNKYNNEYNFEVLASTDSGRIDTDVSFFKTGVHEEIDKIQASVTTYRTTINAIASFFSKIINKKSSSRNCDTVMTESNDKEGYYYTVNKTNANTLTEYLKKHRKLDIYITVGENIEIESAEIEFKPTRGRTKIFVKALEKCVRRLHRQQEKLSRTVRIMFQESMMKYFAAYGLMLQTITRFVMELDFLVSGASVANIYAYCCPQISTAETTGSYFKADNLRHAIVERLCNETEFVPNDVVLGNIPGSNMHNGIMIYGLNSSGKSTIMKAIGLAIILAQIGYYVPASNFEYEPYMSLYARITGNDNIFKGLSSFALEMTELDAILLRTENHGKTTMVIGDEICRGTEIVSGKALVASALISLSEFDASFIFSSHLHEIPTIPEVQDLKNLQIYHLRTEYDETNDCLIYNRKLIPGSGPAVYGLTVAKYMIKNKKFLSRAEKIKKRILAEEPDDLPARRSHFNRDLILRKCSICYYTPTEEHHKELECHHINFQSNCLRDGKIRDKPYLSKNKLYNLVVLCNKCHKRVHRNEIIIKGYLDTTVGPLLNYYFDSKTTLTNGLKFRDKLCCE